MSEVLSAVVQLETEKTESELLRLRSKYPLLVVQIVTMRKPLSPRAVEMIAAQTLRAIRTSSLLADKPEVDLLLRIAGTNQITVALSTIGYKSKGTKLLVAAGPKSQVESLRRSLSQSPSYRMRSSEEVQERDLAAVEKAALLGTRN